MRISPIAIAVAALPLLAQTEPPKTWVDPDTGHRVIRLTDEPGSASLYFNQNWFTPDGKKLVYTSPTGIYTLDLATRATKRVVEGRVRLVEAGHKTPTVYYIRDGAVCSTNAESGSTREIAKLPPNGSAFNYLDRQVISYLKDPIFCAPADKGGFGWTNTDFANLTSFFTAFYAGMTIIAGWVIDKIGTKIGLALSLIVWSLFGIANAFVGRLVTMHILVRSAFAVGEGGNFPASIKTVAEWFPKRERALATGIFNSGSNFGAMVAALFVPWCLVYFGDERGWKMAFIITGAAGFLWLIFWFWLYEIPARQRRLSQVEFDYIHSDKEESTKDPTAEEKPAQGVFGKLFSITGRIPRGAFWGTMILLGILTLFIYLMTSLIAVHGAHLYVPGGGVKHITDTIFAVPNAIGYILAFRIAWLLVVTWIAIALQLKRWHDLDKSGWLVLINLVPVIGTVISLVVLGFFKGGSSPNKFGSEGRPGLLGYRQTWAFFFGKFFTDGVWWFYLFWLPDYLKKQFGMTKQEVMLPTFIVYGVAIIGSVYGGSIPMTLIKRGMPVYQARMMAMLIIAVFPLTVLATQYFGNVGQFRQMGRRAGGGHHLRGSRRTSSMVRKSFHDRLRHVPQKGRRLGYGHWRDGRRTRWCDHSETRGRPDRCLQGNSADRLPHHVSRLRLELPGGLGHHESAGAAAPTHYGSVKISGGHENRRHTMDAAIRREPEVVLRVPMADVRDQVLQPLAAVGQPAANDIGAQQVAQDAAEVLVARIGQKRARIGQHPDKAAEQSEV